MLCEQIVYIKLEQNLPDYYMQDLENVVKNFNSNLRKTFEQIVAQNQTDP